METLSLKQLNDYIGQALSMNFPDRIWVECELAQVSSSKGHVYLEFVDKEEGSKNITAKSSGVIWATNYRLLLAKLGESLYNLLKVGVRVLVEVRVAHHARYGLKLVVEDIDVSYTLGKLEEQRIATIQALKSNGLFDKNQKVPSKIVFQRLAVISSPTAAGYKDFIGQLKDNIYGFNFQFELFPATMQGDKVEKDIIQQFKNIAQRKKDFDAVCIIRGGGSKIDLSDFDKYGVCEAIATSPVPVITGIGHDVDNSIADMVSFLAVKTPTAAAELFVERAIRFESSLLRITEQLKSISSDRLNQEKVKVEQQKNSLLHSASQRINTSSYNLQKKELALTHLADKNIRSEYSRLELLGMKLDGLDPTTQLKKGYAIVLDKKGKRMKSINTSKVGEVINIRLEDGLIDAIVDNVKDIENG